MAIDFGVTSSALGSTIHCSGETADLLTDTEVDEAVKRIRSLLDKSAVEAKAAILKHQAKGAFPNRART